MGGFPIKTEKLLEKFWLGGILYFLCGKIQIVEQLRLCALMLRSKSHILGAKEIIQIKCTSICDHSRPSLEVRPEQINAL